MRPDAGWREVILSFEALAQQHFADNPVAPAAGDKAWAAVLLRACADFEARTWEFGCRDYNSTTRICQECDGDRTGMSWTNLLADAGWHTAYHVTSAVYKTRLRKIHQLTDSRFFIVIFTVLMRCITWMSEEWQL